MANHAIVATRRNEIGERWLRGESVTSIAASMHIPLGTCRHDLHFIRRSLLSGSPDVLRMARARTMAAAELVQAKAWRRIGALEAQAEPDDHAISGYLGVILRGLAQSAKVAGLDGKPADSIRAALLDRAALDWVSEHRPYDPLDELIASSLGGAGGGGWRAAARAFEARDMEYDDDEPDDDETDAAELGESRAITG
jgi:hypothetical protein